MSNAQEVYKANVGNTHEAAVQAVYDAGFDAGVASVTQTQPITADTTIVTAADPNTTSTTTK